MSRIRTIKPDFFLDDELAEMPPLTRLLFIGLWTLADCKGRLEDRPKKIRAQLHPFDDGDTDAMLQALHDSRFIQRYEVDGKRYLEIRTFSKHQRLTGKEADAESNLPAPTVENQQVTGETLGKDFSFPNVQEVEGKRKGRGREEEAPSQATATPAPHPDVLALVENPTPSKPARTVKAPIAPDWEPAKSTYALLEQNGIDRSFATGCIAEFRLYWQERGERRPGWEASFLNNVKRQWDRRSHPTATTHNGRIPDKQAAVIEKTRSAIDDWLAADSAVTVSSIPPLALENSHACH